MLSPISESTPPFGYFLSFSKWYALLTENNPFVVHLQIKRSLG
jgi:hypothetical protein